MSKPDMLVRRVLATALTYGLACVSVAVALLVTLLLRPDELVTPVFFLAIMLSAWFGGIGPGLLAALLATLAIDYFLLQPPYSLKFDPTNVPQLLVFFLSAVLVSSWSAARKRAETLLRRARDEQETKVQERTADLNQANEQLRAEIAERQRAEETLRERANLLDLTHDSVFARDMRDVITYWNRGAAALYGWTREEAVGTVSHQLTQTIFPAPLEEINADLLRTGRWEGELVHAKRDGTRVVVASRWSLQRDEQGNPVAILETNNDITERRRAEAALRESEEQWRAVFAYNPTMYFMVDAAGTILSVNLFGAEQLGYTVDALVGQPVLQVFYAADRKAVRRNVALCFEQLGRALSWECRKVHTDGTVLWVRETARAVLIKNRPVILIACEDITERKRAEEALQKAQTELAHITRVTTLGELATSIAHEINQPLAAIVTNGSACLRWLAGTPPHLDDAREALHCIIADGQRASAIITRIRASLRKTDIEKTWLDLPQLVHEVVRLTQPELVRQGVTLRVEVAATLPPVWGDRVQVQQVLLNLVLNALEALATVTERPRELVIRVRPETADTVRVAVEDTGVGIAPEQLDQMFTAFYTTKAQGLGMGLAISRTIVEQHGGRLWAVPHDGPGATVQFTLRTVPEADERR
jgi:PAS domain S-box-containing protein